MNLYKLSQNKHRGHDTYDSAIVCAENEEEARNTKIGHVESFYSSWVEPQYIKVELIGVANDSIPKGIILASFNAG